MAEMLSAVSQQYENLLALEAMLDEELKLITGRDADQLLALVNNKTELLNKINQNTSLVTALRLPREELETELAKKVEQCHQLLVSCQKKTQTNGVAVEQGQVRIQNLRNIILNTRHKESMTYDKAGLTKGGTLGGSIKA